MERFEVYIKNGKCSVNLEDPLVLRCDRRLLIKPIFAGWRYSNVVKGFNDTVKILTTGSKRILKPGFWTSEDFTEYFDHNISGVLLETDGKLLRFKSSHKLDIGHLAPILGFADSIIGSGNVTADKEFNPIALSEYIKVYCPTLQRSTTESNGKKTDLILSIPTTRYDSLGTGQAYRLEENTSVRIKKGTYNKLEFNALWNSGLPADADILFIVYIV